VSARQLEAETAQETKKALEELLDSNRDYFDSQPVFSPSKKDIVKGFKGLLSHLSPQKRKRAAPASLGEENEFAEVPKNPRKVKKVPASDKTEDSNGVGSQSLLISLEIQKWTSKLSSSRSKGMNSPHGAKSPTSPKASRSPLSPKSPKNAWSPKNPLSPKSPSLKRKVNQMDVAQDEKPSEDPRGMKLALEEPAVSPTSNKRRRADTSETSMPLSPLSAAKSEPMLVVNDDSIDQLYASTAPDFNLAETVILTQGRSNRNSATFRNQQLSQKLKTTVAMSPEKKTASPKPVFQSKENLVNGSPAASPSRRNASGHLRGSSQPSFSITQ